MSLNQVCIIDGDYNVTIQHDEPKNSGSSTVSCSSPSERIQDNLDHLIESYKSKMIMNADNQSDQMEPSISDYSKFVLIHSKDGSELYTNLLQSFGLNTSDLDNTLNSNASSDTTLSTGGVINKTQQRTTNTNYTTFVCFLISDFDQNDKVFIKLEETQLKLSNFLNALSSNITNASSSNQKRFMIFGWPVLHYCLEKNLPLTSAVDVERPLYCKLMSGCFVCFTGFRKENKHTVAYCIKLVHYMGGSVRKEYNKKITHLIVKSTLSTKYKTAYNIGRCHLLTEEWIIDAWKHRNEVDFNVNNEEFLKKFKLKALYSLSIAFYGFTNEETQHMKEVTIENGGTPICDLNDENCTHIVINDQEVKQVPILTLPTDSDGSILAAPSLTTTAISTSTSQLTPTVKANNGQSNAFNPNSSPFSNTRASIVKAEWFWASIQICCRASECLYEFSKSKTEIFNPKANIDPPTKRIKLSVDNLLSHETLNIGTNNNHHNTSSTDSPHNQRQQQHSNNTPNYHTNARISNSHINNTSINNTKNSSNNLLNNVLISSNGGGVGCTNSINECDSPTLGLHMNGRLSTGERLYGNTNRNNMSNNNLSTSASLLDATTDDVMSIDSPFEKQRDSGHGLLNSASSNGANSSKKMSKRSQRIYELYETEKRFVNILHTIICYFKEPIEAPDQVAGPILDQTEVKEIFGNLPPIYEVHCKIKDRLERLANRINVNEESISVGEIYVDNADALLKTYPPFVNFYEKTKDAIVNCDKNKPRFHAFLKITQGKPECGRQTLVELFIRPVQRLPSTLLLLDDILKETPKTHRDHELLTKAIASLKEVMTHINEDKRKIENQLAMFVLINDIENCPATLLSSHRHFLKKLDVHETSNELLKKGAQLTLFLFSDCLEICKPRMKILNAAKSPNAVSKQRTPQKCYKHIALFSLNNVTKVCDILQNNDDTDLFGILCRLTGEKDKFFSFKVIPSTSSSSTNINTSASTNNISTMSTANLSTVNNTTSNGYCSTISSTTSSSSNNYTTIYASTTNLNFFDEHYQAQIEKKEYIKLLAQGICNVKCITEYESSKTALIKYTSSTKDTNKSLLLTSPELSSITYNTTLSSSFFSSDSTSINLELSSFNSSSYSQVFEDSAFISNETSFQQTPPIKNDKLEKICCFDEDNSNIKFIENVLNQEIDLVQQYQLHNYIQTKSLEQLNRNLFHATPNNQHSNLERLERKSEPIISKRYTKNSNKSLRMRTVQRSCIYNQKKYRLNNRTSFKKLRREPRQTKNCDFNHLQLKREKTIQQNQLIIQHLKKKENILCTIEAKQLQIDLNESGGSKKLDAVKSYARIINRRVSRAFSFSQDTPNKIKKTISSVFRSPFQSSYSQQSLNEQKASKLTSLASLQLTPTLMETKRKFITLQKSRDTLAHPFFKNQTLSNIQTTSSLLSLDCGSTSEENCSASSNCSSTKIGSSLSLEQTISKNDEDVLSGSKKMPDITNLFQTNSLKRQFT